MMKSGLWAPWRIKYITVKKQKGCIFCQAVRKQRKDYVIFKTKHAIAMLNSFPYNNGHIMVSPLRHVREFTQLKETETLDLIHALNKVKELLGKVLRPQGYNIGFNIGKASGAGIAGHLHIHIVPRWIGDTNFMPILYDTKIISQSLDELHRQLKKALNAQSKTAQRV